MSDSERAVKAESPTASDNPGESPPDLRPAIALFAVVLAATIVAVVMLAQRPHTSASVRQAPLPVGQFKGLATLQTPSGTIDTHSRFVFEAEGSSGTGPRSEYWYAYPTASTIYQINGLQIGVSEFGRRLAKMPPMQVDVDASVSGKLDRINAVFPRGAPQ